MASDKASTLERAEATSDMDRLPSRSFWKPKGDETVAFPVAV